MWISSKMSQLNRLLLYSKNVNDKYLFWNKSTMIWSQNMKKSMLRFVQKYLKNNLTSMMSYPECSSMAIFSWRKKLIWFMALRKKLKRHQSTPTRYSNYKKWENEKQNCNTRLCSTKNKWNTRKTWKIWRNSMNTWYNRKRRATRHSNQRHISMWSQKSKNNQSHLLI